MGTSSPPLSASSPPIETLLRRVREEYREMPSLRLTALQAQRLFGLEPLACAAILGALIQERFLSRTRGGLFVRGELRVSGFAGART
jgi:hypothetical protein